MMILFCLITFANLIIGTPSIGLPINSQVPPVARTSKEFRFVFSESTFTSSLPILGYSLSNSPKWLQLDSQSRTLSGTPGSGDPGSVSFNLIATDSTGSASMPVTLVVSSDPGPGLGVSVLDQLYTHGFSSSLDSLIMPHSSLLSISFLPGTFTSTDDHTLYYAISANNTPLPSWISFDSKALSFTGTTPQTTSPAELSQSYGIRLTASDVAGFSGASIEFHILVESHPFAFRKTFQTISATQGSSFNFSGFQTDLMLDGRPTNRSDINQFTADTPDWISLDQSSLTISGTLPTFVVPQNFTVMARNIYGDEAKTIIAIEPPERSSSNLFKHPFSQLNATAGTSFEYTIDRSSVVSANATVSADLGKAASWLNFDSNSLRLYGNIPNDTQAQSYLVNITIARGPISQSQTITIFIEENETNNNSESGPIKKASGAGSSNSNRSTSNESKSRVMKKRWLPLIILAPTAIASGVILAVFLCLRKKRRKQRYYVSRGPSKEKISHPMPTDSSWITIQENETVKKEDGFGAQDLESNQNGTSGTMRRRESSRPPKVEIRGLLSSSPNKRSSLFPRSRSEADHRGQALQGDSWREYIRNFHGVRPESAVPEFRLVPEEEISLQPKAKDQLSKARQSDPSAYSVSSIDSRIRRYSRYGKSRSGMSFTSAALFSSHHLRGYGRAGSGMGHGIRLSDTVFGRDYTGPHGFGMMRNSWRNMSTRSKNTIEYATTTTTTTTTDSSSQHLTSKHSENLASLVQAFPAPASKALDVFSRSQPIAETEQRQNPHRPTIRIVNSPPQTPLRRKSTLQAFHKHRVSSRQTQNPLFSAGPSSRTSSHSLWKKKKKKKKKEARNPNPLSPSSPSPSTSTPVPNLHRSYSQSSSLLSPSPLPPHPSHHPYPHTSTTSLTSSQQFGSAASSPCPSPPLPPSNNNNNNTTIFPHPSSHPSPAFVHIWHNTDPHGAHAYSQRGFVLGNRERRPVSVSLREGLGKGASMRGELRYGGEKEDGNGNGNGSGDKEGEGEWHGTAFV